MSRHRPLVVVGSVLLAVALAGCVAPTPVPSPAPTLDPTPPATTDPEPAGPTPRIDASCENVIDLAALREFVGAGTQQLEAVAPAERLSPDAASIDQLGALACQWSNGLQGVASTGPDPDLQDVRLSILPEGLDAAIAYVDLYQIADPTYGDHVQGPRCMAPSSLGGGRGFCELYGVIGETWVELHVGGIVADASAGDADLVAGFRSVIDPMVATIGAMIPRERWVPTEPSAIAESDCETLAPTDAIIGVTGISNLIVVPHWDGPRVGQYWYSTGAVGALACSLGVADSESSVGQVAILPSGSWGFDRFADAWRADGGSTTTVPGAVDGAAISRCGDPADACTLDFVVESDWVRVVVPPTPAADMQFGIPASSYASARAAVDEIAEIVAERISAR